MDLQTFRHRVARQVVTPQLMGQSVRQRTQRGATPWRLSLPDWLEVAWSEGAAADGNPATSLDRKGE